MSEKHLPTLREMLALEVPLEVIVSPNGKRAAISVRRADWNANRYESRCLVYEQGWVQALPLTREGSVLQMEWVDDAVLALLKSPASGGEAPQDKPQIWLYEGLVGEGWRVTEASSGVEGFKPFAGGFVYLAANPEREEKKARQEKFGSFVHFEQEESASALYYTGLQQVRKYQDALRGASEEEAKQLTLPVIELSKLFTQPLHIERMVVSPQGEAVYLNCRRGDDLVYLRQGSAWCLQLDAQQALEEYLRREKERKVEEKKAGKEGPAAEPADGSVEPVSGSVQPVSGSVQPVSGSVQPVSGNPEHVQAADVPKAAEAVASSEQHRPDEAARGSEDAPAAAPTAGKADEKEDLAYLGKLTRLNMPARARVSAVSPDGAQLLIDYQARDDKMYTQSDLWIIEKEAALAAPDEASFVAAMRCISAAFDQEVLTAYWVESGIYGMYFAGTEVRLARFDGDGGYCVLDLRLEQGEALMPWWDFHITRAGVIGLVAANAERFQEAYLGHAAETSSSFRLMPLTEYGKAIADWSLGRVETIRWISRDGVEIEGVLRKPPDFDPGKKYPLVFVVHGGPRDSSQPFLLSGEDLRYYPSAQFANQGVLVLKPNYRGSLGRGQAFMELNVDNLGVGDLWDLESAVDALVEKGWVDAERVGCMGWSQGGYISAFAGLHSQKFKAVSVGAGISDWYTYHISNDIPDFTLDYLSGSPFRDRERYIKTAPISGLPTASTPMLIQHGSDDRRVPLSNALELYRGLKEMGIPVELFIFPGMAHPITRPRQNHAVLHQNLNWFCHYLLGEELELLD